MSMTAARSVTATFALHPTTYTLTVTKAGTGTGHRDLQPQRDQLRQHLQREL